MHSFYGFSIVIQNFVELNSVEINKNSIFHPKWAKVFKISIFHDKDQFKNSAIHCSLLHHPAVKCFICKILLLNCTFPSNCLSWGPIVCIVFVHSLHFHSKSYIYCWNGWHDRMVSVAFSAISWSKYQILV